MGYLFLLFYVLLVGVATFLAKSSLKSLDPYQLNLLMGIGMLIIGAIAIWLANKSFRVPSKELPIGIAIGSMMSAGSVFYVLALNKLSASVASVIAASYVGVVIVLSWIFLKESMDWIKITGLIVTVAGIFILSYKA